MKGINTGTIVAFLTLVFEVTIQQTRPYLYDDIGDISVLTPAHDKISFVGTNKVAAIRTDGTPSIRVFDFDLATVSATVLYDEPLPFVPVDVAFDSNNDHIWIYGSNSEIVVLFGSNGL